MKYSLIINFHEENKSSFIATPIISIDGQSLTEILAKLPLQINLYRDQLNLSVIRNQILKDDDIPF